MQKNNGNTLPTTRMGKLIARVRENDFSAWLDLQRYKMYHPLGTRFAIWWLKVRYGWDDKTEEQ